ncbi:MAG: fused MFS/spermidine synthase [Actinomycetes bacterium]
MEDHGAVDSRAARAATAIVATVGVASLGSEIAGARLLAPYFGTSTIIWANTIAVVLLSLSLGYWLGGRAADRDPSLAGLCRLVLAAALLLACVPFLAKPVLGLAVDALSSISVGAFLGSLAAVLVLLALPLILLGAAAPYAVRLSVRSVEESGRVTGRLYAISTVGSLVGVFSSSLLLIPFAGTRLTFLAYSLLLALVSTVGFARRGLAAAAVIGVVALLPVGTIKAAEPGSSLLAEQDTEYGYARIVETPDGGRQLELNEGVAVHSLLRADRGPLTGGYWDEIQVLPWSSDRGGKRPERILILGNAGGTAARAFTMLDPRVEVDGVELDPKISELGRRWLGMPGGPRFTLHDGDARYFLRSSAGPWDAIVVDAYRQPYIPFHLATREFFAEAAKRLAPGGVVIVNVGHPADDSGLERSLTATLRSVFPTVLRDPAQIENTQLIAGNGAISAEVLLGAAAEMPGAIRPIAVDAARRLEPGLDGGDVWTDDRAPVEWLVDLSIVKAAAAGG